MLQVLGLKPSGGFKTRIPIRPILISYWAKHQNRNIRNT